VASPITSQYFEAYRLPRKVLGMLKIRVVSAGVAGIPIEQLAVAESEVTATEYLGKTVQCTDAWDRNKTMPYYTVHQLFPAITLPLMSPYKITLYSLSKCFADASNPQSSSL
jgi:hypothetical protein